MDAIEQLKSVLCDPEGKCCIAGSDEDRAIIDRALQALTQRTTPPAAQPAPVQEPVAWAVFEGRNAHDLYLPQEYVEALKMAGYKGDHAEVKPLYTTPPAAQRTWVGLTDEEIIDVIHPLVMADMPDEATDYEIAKAIEAKLRSKNT